MYYAAVIAILVTMALALIRAFIGPSVYDRMLAANVFGTKTVLLIAVGGYVLSWPAFLDVALLYALTNFVGTIAVMRFFEYSDQASCDVQDGGER
ncbi:MAG: monovalent cation/H+ antiporter complex subunit F [Motiliproteus sp.]|nr:monovalent cation/H+ antiporter complex subunit F [Motiliproteus sp.]